METGSGEMAEREHNVEVEKKKEIRVKSLKHRYIITTTTTTTTTTVTTLATTQHLRGQLAGSCPPRRGEGARSILLKAIIPRRNTRRQQVFSTH
ncbi:hypothetical protein E2C01_035266 [Portunus trituberculatus]|uniref:Uncharacterized protein n=1 Tax=Portunus trituberculatus TaxID=210409 RepID=A0A5B7F8S0_PORTR|nr:hypothetical protein [Portunus trituberculatus]